ncbi:hypothetical protein ACFXQA_09080 [Microbacterium sp. P07]|uniref:hypothetical protein n=1 Tax=Microbacterium sp. P07 TaxID=3366952 RepID=UPI003745A694
MGECGGTSAGPEPQWTTSDPPTRREALGLTETWVEPSSGGTHKPARLAALMHDTRPPAAAADLACSSASRATNHDRRTLSTAPAEIASAMAR